MVKVCQNSKSTRSSSLLDIFEFKSQTLLSSNHLQTLQRLFQQKLSTMFCQCSNAYWTSCLCLWFVSLNHQLCVKNVVFLRLYCIEKQKNFTSGSVLTMNFIYLYLFIISQKKKENEYFVIIILKSKSINANCTLSKKHDCALAIGLYYEECLF